MAEWLATVTLAHASGIAEDNVVNTFAIDTDTWDPATELLQLSGPISNFYNAIDQYYSAEISRAASAHIIRYYLVTGNLDGSPHGSPLWEDAFTMLTAAAGVQLPAEVAFVLTLRADTWESQQVEVPDTGDAGTEPDRPRQRHSGRIFLGPLNAEAVEVDASGRSRPSAAFRTAVLDSAETNLVDGLAANGHQLSVWSRKDAIYRPVSHLQVDDAWDTQRRRGTDATARTTRAV